MGLRLLLLLLLLPLLCTPTPPRLTLRLRLINYLTDPPPLRYDIDRNQGLSFDEFQALLGANDLTAGHASNGEGSVDLFERLHRRTGDGGGAEEDDDDGEMIVDPAVFAAQLYRAGYHLVDEIAPPITVAGDGGGGEVVSAGGV